MLQSISPGAPGWKKLVICGNEASGSGIVVAFGVGGTREGATKTYRSDPTPPFTVGLCWSFYSSTQTSTQASTRASTQTPSQTAPKQL